ncbi:hypothetical protein C8T65DRAFT_668265 [Cerioporus squamosus]|nr:hypothetical protein C8T65DRAFT_668265 [Cerioporus squamosus]
MDNLPVASGGGYVTAAQRHYSCTGGARNSGRYRGASEVLMRRETGELLSLQEIPGASGASSSRG